MAARLKVHPGEGDFDDHARRAVVDHRAAALLAGRGLRRRLGFGARKARAELHDAILGIFDAEIDATHRRQDVGGEVFPHRRLALEGRLLGRIGAVAVEDLQHGIALGCVGRSDELAQNDPRGDLRLDDDAVVLREFVLVVEVGA